MTDLHTTQARLPRMLRWTFAIPFVFGAITLFPYLAPLSRAQSREAATTATSDATSAEPTTGPTTRQRSRATPPATVRPSTPAWPRTMEELRAAYALPPEQWPGAHWDDSIPAEQRIELGRVPEPEYPADNPYTAAKAELGKRLFWDPRLSGSTFVACVSCHHPDTGWGDGRTTSMGHQLASTKRNAPSIMGSVYLKKLMWDGRADSLEDQALLPLVNEQEMHGAFADVEKNLNAIPAYVAEFKEVFGTEKIELEHIQKAIATFERTIVPGRSRFDSFVAGRNDALRDAELRGLHLFRTQARCINCHSGPLMTDQQFHNIGLTQYRRAFEDLGRYHQTKDPKDVGAFRTPSLRNVGRTEPYMHNGLFEIDVLLTLYNAGMPNERAPAGDPLAPKKSHLLKQLGLSIEDRRDIEEFLVKALEEPRFRIRQPVLPGLYGADANKVPKRARPSTAPAEDGDDADAVP